MIASINGVVIAVAEQDLVIEVGGIGLQIHVPPMLAKKMQIGDRLFLHTCFIVREDSLSLYGFEDVQEKKFFELFLGVNGIGPRTALAAVSTLSVDLIRRAVISEQSEIFSRIPGVGKKGAQKILLHLQGKIGDGPALEEITGVDIDMEILDALTALGYSIVEAQSALQSIPRDTAQDLEERLRIALSYFSR
jgi:Holliday junction DNA helicase RuvA